MEDYIKSRVLREAGLVIKKQLTVRQVAQEVGFSKSTVFRDLTERLPLINRTKARKVRKVLDKHKFERASRGGKAAAAYRRSERT